MFKEFTIVIEQDEDGIYVASVPELEGCHLFMDHPDGRTTIITVHSGEDIGKGMIIS